jgi:hypothetical protein
MEVTDDDREQEDNFTGKIEKVIVGRGEQRQAHKRKKQGA